MLILFIKFCALLEKSYNVFKSISDEPVNSLADSNNESIIFISSLINFM